SINDLKRPTNMSIDQDELYVVNRTNDIKIISLLDYSVSRNFNANANATISCVVMSIFVNHTQIITTDYNSRIYKGSLKMFDKKNGNLTTTLEEPYWTRPFNMSYDDINHILAVVDFAQNKIVMFK